MDPCWWGITWVLVAILVACQGQTEEDEKRPYKFAFAIEGYQHRSEEKDERGIIMGEFGFVTGDGVYHLTVYATDENGDFKILKMKNYYIGLPGEGTTVAPTRAPPPPTPSTTKNPILQHIEGLQGCSSCVIPDKGKGQPNAAPPSNSDHGEGLLDERFDDNVGGPLGSPSPGSPAAGRPSYNKKPVGGGGKQPFSVSGGSGGPGGPVKQPGGSAGPVTGFSGSPQRPGGGGGSPQYNPPPGGQLAQRPKPPGKGDGPEKPFSAGGFGQNPSPPGGTLPSQGNDRRPELPSYQGAGPPGRPQSQGPGDRPSPRPGQKPQYVEGLPPGMTVKDMMELLYKFNYTLKFHGHHESGYRNGDKEGGYFFNGRDGLGRDVKYLANEFGFQPNITLVDLGLSSPDTPKGGDDELNNELKGYEFKWFYSR